MEQQPPKSASADPSSSSDAKGGTARGAKVPHSATVMDPPSERPSKSEATKVKKPAMHDPDEPSFEDFRLIKKLGEGAMGAVYKAYQISADREVALKVILPHIARNPKIIERFNREAQTMGLLDHDNVVVGYALNEENGCYYFAMEFVDGRSVQDWLTDMGKFSVGDALYVIINAARGMQHAHEQTLVHRDIKPANIMITRQGVVKVADFGMVKQLDDDVSVTQTGTGIGTPAYMPLEQARNAKEVDGRSDIYALGCTLYCLLTGQPPFTGQTLVELIKAQEIGIFAPARKFNQNVPDRLDLIIHKMCAKLVKHRYQNCGEVIRDLAGLGLANESLSFIKAEGPGAKAAAAAPKAAGPASTAGAKAPPGSILQWKEEPKLDEDPELWYLRYQTADGQTVTKKLRTHEILDLLKDEKFDSKAQASHSPDDGFRHLATYREFESRMQSRLIKARTDTQANRFKSLYKAAERAEELKAEREAQQPEEGSAAYRMLTSMEEVRWRTEDGTPEEPEQKAPKQKKADKAKKRTESDEEKPDTKVDTKAEERKRAALQRAAEEAEGKATVLIDGFFCGALAGLLAGIPVGVLIGMAKHAVKETNAVTGAFDVNASSGAGFTDIITGGITGIAFGFIVGGVVGIVALYVARRLAPFLDELPHLLSVVVGAAAASATCYLVARNAQPKDDANFSMVKYLVLAAGIGLVVGGLWPFVRNALFSKGEPAEA